MTFLTIDVDYWMHERSIDLDYIDMVISKGFPVNVVLFHHEVVETIHRNCPRSSRIINVDYHSDIADIKQSELSDSLFNEGTWLNFVSNPGSREYIWIYPEDESWYGGGKCHSDVDVLVETSYLEWKKISSRKRVLPGEVILKDVAYGNICLSPNWLPQPKFVEILHYLRYKKIISAEYLDACKHITKRNAWRMVSKIKMNWEERTLAEIANSCYISEYNQEVKYATLPN